MIWGVQHIFLELVDLFCHIIYPFLAPTVYFSHSNIQSIGILTIIFIIFIIHLLIYYLYRYLQWLIEEQESGDCQFHTIYAVSLAKSALEVVEMDSMTQTSSDVLEAGSASEREDGRSSRLSIRETLQLFLHSSDLYDPEEVLYLIERSELWIEKVVGCL